MAVRRKLIRKTVEELLEENGIKEPPVHVEKISQNCGLPVIRQNVDNTEISGFIFRSKGKAVIGVNPSHPEVRQRFTIAHELGHYLMHPPGTDDVHIDKDFEIRFRDNLSSQGTDTNEREANFFAAELLMPLKFIQDDLEKLGKADIAEGKLLEELAKRYEVSTQSLLFRLVNLGILSSQF